MHAHVGVDGAGMPGAGCEGSDVRLCGVGRGGLPAVVAAPALQAEQRVGGAGVAAAQAHGCGAQGGRRAQLAVAVQAPAAQ